VENSKDMLGYKIGRESHIGGKDPAVSTPKFIHSKKS
jgi:hypothetical protein